jgi:hypothetical protein
MQKGLSDTNNDLLLASKCKIMVVDEISSDTKLNSTTIKTLTGYSSTYIRGIYEEGNLVDFKGVLMLAGNGLPNMELTEAIIKRLIIFPFAATFTTNSSEVDEDKYIYNACDFSNSDYQELAIQLFTLCHARIMRCRDSRKFEIPKSLKQFKMSIIKALDGINYKLMEMNLIESESDRDFISYDNITNLVSIYNRNNKIRLDPIEFLGSLKQRFPFNDAKCHLYKLINEN